MKLFKKVASATLIMAMVLSLFSGLSVSANEGTLVFHDTFDTFAPATPSNSTLPTGWTKVSDAQGVKFGADTDIAGTHGLKVQWPNTNRALATYAKDVNVDLEGIDKVELSARIKFPDSTAGKNNYKMMFTLHDGGTVGDVAGFEFQNGGSTGTSKGVEVRAYTSDSPSYFGTGDLVADTPAANFQFSQWNDIKAIWTAEDGKVEYFVNNVSLGKKAQKASTTGKFAKVRFAFLGNSTDAYVSFDDIKLVTYSQPGVVPEVTVGELAIKNSTGVAATFPSAGDTAKASVNIANPTDAAYKATLIIAVYDNYGVLKEAKLSALDIPKETAAADYDTDTITIASDCVELKAFLWTGLDTMKPIDYTDLLNENF